MSCHAVPEPGCLGANLLELGHGPDLLQMRLDTSWQVIQEDDTEKVSYPFSTDLLAP